MDQVTPQLWITDIDTVRTDPVPTDWVVTVCQDDVFDNVDCTCIQVNLADGPNDDYKNGSDTYSTFANAVDYVLTGLRGDQSVLVHCHMGVSRSAAVCTAALAIYEDCSYEDALQRVATARPRIDPKAQLRRYARRAIDDDWV